MVGGGLNERTCGLWDRRVGLGVGRERGMVVTSDQMSPLCFRSDPFPLRVSSEGVLPCHQSRVTDDQ